MPCCPSIQWVGGEAWVVTQGATAIHRTRVPELDEATTVQGHMLYAPNMHVKSPEGCEEPDRYTAEITRGGRDK